MERTTLWNRDFGAYWLGLASAALGDALVVIALPFLVLAVSGDPRAIATTLLAASIARFAGPVVGALADRLPLRPMLVLAGVSRALLFGGMGALAVGAELPLAVVYLVAFLNGLVSTYVFAAGNVAVPRLVPQGELARASSRGRTRSCKPHCEGFPSSALASQARSSAGSDPPRRSSWRRRSSASKLCSARSSGV